MNIFVKKTPRELGKAAALHGASILRKAIKEKGSARLILSTGASQFETMAHLIKENLDWSRVEMFHLDEYIGLPESHKASFRAYLKKRFTSRVKLKAAHFVSGEGDVEKNIRELDRAFRKAPVDLGFIGIGTNAHIAFNDPPADFATKKSFIIVKLDKTCKQQQVGEGWFENLKAVPSHAITMSPNAIMKCRHIISSVPFEVKAAAVYNSLTREVNPGIPSSLLKTHPDWSLYLDRGSAGKLFPL